MEVLGIGVNIQELEFKGSSGRLRGLLLGMWTALILIGSIWAHEEDIHNNCAEKGLSHSWFYEISCKEIENNE